MPGCGVEGRFGDAELRLGSGAWATRSGLATDDLVPDQEHLGTTLYLMDETRVLARFDLDERPRQGAAQSLEALRELGVELSLLSGDRPEAAAAVGESLGLPATGGLLPAAKAARLQRARRDGAAVAMVGDGINDAPVLAAADVGIAIGSASDLARRSGNVRLLSDRLERIPELLQLARDVRRRIRLNLGFAFTFNSIGIGLAAAGLLTPVFAALAMVASSLAVVKISSGAGGTSFPTRRADAEPAVANVAAVPAAGGS